MVDCRRDLGRQQTDTRTYAPQAEQDERELARERPKTRRGKDRNAREAIHACREEAKNARRNARMWNAPLARAAPRAGTRHHGAHAARVEVRHD